MSETAEDRPLVIITNYEALGSVWEYHFGRYQRPSRGWRKHLRKIKARSRLDRKQ